MKRTICFVTGSRADYGLILDLMRLVRNDPGFDLRLVVTGAHLAAGFGDTQRAILEDGFTVDARVDMLLAGDNPVAVTKATGLAVIGFADALDRLAPDLLFIPGDRYEMLAAAQAALIARVPVAHLCGGDVTEGAFDEAIRHSITKMAHLHFVTNRDARHRVCQMGEAPETVFEVGSPGLDVLLAAEPMDRESFFASVGMEPGSPTLLVTFHPPTLDALEPAVQLEEMLAALENAGPDAGLIFTGTNADTEGRRLNARIMAFAAAHRRACFHPSLGLRRYAAALRHVSAVVGNSSSGLYEAPSFAVPTVNIGDRQKGRLRAASVIDCPPDRAAIRQAIGRALSLDCSAVVNPYGDGKSAPRILAALKAVADPAALLKKRFHDWGTP